MISAKDVYKAYQYAKGKWSTPPYVPNIDKLNLTSISKKRSDWNVFESIARKINEKNSNIDLTNFINGLFYLYRDSKKIYPRMFLNREAMTGYIKYVEYINTLSNAQQIQYIKESAEKIEEFMNETGLNTFEDYLKENYQIYPIFINHLNNGMLNYYLLTAYHKMPYYVNNLENDLKEDIQHFIKNVETIKLRILTIPEFTKTTDECLRRLGV